ncbi:hypothetical protein [Acinetobacter pittii]|uniref:hypothetical protein n=1 Tax=Acinetobacter pittii TaxID=48296 RepID=UPI00396F3C6A
MKNLITATEAVAALQKGKTVLCRYADDMSDFEDLDQFTATVFGRPGFEFCIKIETIELAGITFTKPLTVDELEVGTEVFVINPAGFIEKHVYQGVGYGIVTMVDGGFAQRDLDNARLQYEALCKLLGGNPINDAPLKTVEVLEAEDKQTKKRTNKKHEVKTEQLPVIDKPTEIVAAEAQPVIVITEQTNVTTSEDLLIQPSVESAIKPNNYDDLLQSVQNAHTPEEVNSVITYTSKWTEEQRKPLLTEMHKRLSELKQTRQQDNELSPLILRIQHAVDIKTLEELELEIPSRHHDVHKTLWNMAKKRRAQLNAASNEPDYLLGDQF